MNADVFSFERFSKYLKFELKSAYESFGLSLLILSCINVVLFLVFGTLGYLGGVERTWCSVDPSFTRVVFVICVFILFITMPRKCYGYVTEKRAGTSFLMIPASSLEKTLSMILICGIIVPAVFFAVSLGLDELLFLIDSGRGTSLISDLTMCIDDFLFFDREGFGTLDDVSGLCLVFLLGSIFFKKSKGGKTILCLMAIAFVLGGLIAGLARAYVETRSVDLKFPDLSQGAKFAIDAAINLLVCALIFWRVRTIKH